MSFPKVVIQILITGAGIFGKAFLAAAKQAAKNARHTPQGTIGNDAAGVGNATSGTLTDTLTRAHRMTSDEARLILNVKRGDEMEKILKHYDHLFKVNSPQPPPEAPIGGRKPVVPEHSHYLQSKVVRARERLEAELKAQAEQEAAAPGKHPPPPDGGMSTGAL